MEGDYLMKATTPVFKFFLMSNYFFLGLNQVLILVTNDIKSA